MAAEIEAVAVADLGLGDAADLVLGLEDDHGPPLLGEQIARGQPGRAAAEHGDRLARVAFVGTGVPGAIEFNSRHADHHARAARNPGQRS